MRTSRRSFLKTSAAAVLGFPAILRAANLNSNFQVAAIGCAGKGLSDIAEVGSHQRVKFVGFCDVDLNRFAQVDKKFPGVAHHQDYREMLEKLGAGVDGVIVSTPDHLHAPMAMDAMRRGKHVYCQKPLTHTVWEARQIRLQAEKSGVVTQMGNQIHSATQYRTAVKLLRDGAIGKIKEVHSWQGNKGNGYTKLTAAPEPGPVPEGFSWDLWLGPAPMREYSPTVYHPFNWRDWQDFGGGTMGDFGCHILDPIFTALELGAPRTIRGESEGLNAQTWPSSETIQYVFPGNAFTAKDTLALTWYDGGRMPSDDVMSLLPADGKRPKAGSLVIGESGALLIPHVAMPQLLPADKFASTEIEKVPGSSHYHAWVDAALGGSRTTDHFSYAGQLTEVVQLGNIAGRIPGVTLEWDSKNLRFPNHPEADRYLTKTYRAGWQIDPVV